MLPRRERALLAEALRVEAKAAGMPEATAEVTFVSVEVAADRVEKRGRKSGTKVPRWTPEEEARLRALIEELGEKQWGAVAGRLLVFHNTYPGTATKHAGALHAGLPVGEGEQVAAGATLVVLT